MLYVDYSFRNVNELVFKINIKNLVKYKRFAEIKQIIHIDKKKSNTHNSRNILSNGFARYYSCAG